MRYQFSNHLSTATLELDSSAALISYEEYYPYGSTSYQGGASVAEVSLTRYRFTGKERDEYTGLYYHGARYYCPWLARWVAADPLESKYTPQSPFIYCSDNPVVRLDPTGKGDYYSKEGKLLGHDDKTVKEGKGKHAKNVPDDKAFVTDKETIDKFTKDGNVDWDKVRAAESTKDLGISNSVLGMFANTIARESGGAKLESFALASAMINLAKYKNKDILTTLKTQGIYGYNGKKDFSNTESSLEAAINALTGGKDYSNGAIRWDGYDLAQKGFTHIKARAEYGIEISQAHFDKFKAAWPDKAIAKFSGNKDAKFSTNFSSGMHRTTEGAHIGTVLLKSTAVEGGTLFWGINKDPVIKETVYDPVSLNPNTFLGMAVQAATGGTSWFQSREIITHVNAGFKGWGGSKF